MRQVLVTAATGRQCGPLAESLLAQGTIVHALVRNAQSHAARALKDRGAVLFQGSFDDVAVIEKAMEGAQGLFLNTFPTPNPRD